MTAKSVGDLDNRRRTERQVTCTGHYFKFPTTPAAGLRTGGTAIPGKAVPTAQGGGGPYGTETYVFEQVIPKTQTASREVPASLFSPTGTGNVTAKVMYGNTRTFVVEPNTGAATTKGQEKVDKTPSPVPNGRDDGGHDRLQRGDH